MSWVDSILHPSDFTEASELAFAHALKLALACRADLNLLHVHGGALDSVPWEDFPGVRATLERWGLLEPGSARSAVQEQLGMRVDKVAATRAKSPLDWILGYLRRTPADLIVVATEGREGLPRWLHSSVAEPLARESETMTLFVPAGARGFVSPADGSVKLERILLPVDATPPAHGALAGAAGLAEALGNVPADVTLLHVGEPGSAPALQPPQDGSLRWHPATRSGNVVDTIVAAAEEGSADLLVMATEGHHGFLDAVRGSTTERVLRRASCPVLAIPAH